jgi:dTDP-4-dehydrorhamnose reductase
MKYEKVLVFGAGGMLGTALKKLVSEKNFFLTDKDTSSNLEFCDIRDLPSVNKIVENYKPDIIINFAALVDLEHCEKEKDDCYLTNTISAIHLFNLSKGDDFFCNKNFPWKGFERSC